MCPYFWQALVALRRVLLAQFSAFPLNGADLYEELKTSTAILSTGIGRFVCLPGQELESRASHAETTKGRTGEGSLDMSGNLEASELLRFFFFPLEYKDRGS